MAETRRYIEDLLSRGNNRNGASGGGNANGRSQSQTRGSPSNSKVIEIDPSMVGLIIGRGGSKIRELEEKFKVNLKIGQLIDVDNWFLRIC